MAVTFRHHLIENDVEHSASCEGKRVWKKHLEQADNDEAVIEQVGSMKPDRDPVMKLPRVE
jgi:hypothetical protein